MTEPVVLTPRQFEVIALTAEGLSYKQVGRRLGIGLETVKSHSLAAQRALGGRNRPHAIAQAFRAGVLPLSEDLSAEDLGGGS